MPLLPIPFEFQATGSDCVVSCLEQCTRYLGKSIDGKEIIKHQYYDKGIILADAASLVANMGYKVRILTYNLVFLNPEKEGVDALEICDTIRMNSDRNLRDHDKRMGGALLHAVESGVALSIVRPRESVLCNFIDKKLPVIVSVNPSGLYAKQGDTHRGHAISIVGYQDKTMFVSDPSHETIESIPAEDLLFGITSRGILSLSAWGLVVEART